MKLRTVSAYLVLVMLAGCGSETSGTAEPAAEQPTVTGLTCPTDARHLGTVDYFSDVGGAATPESAARAMAEPADGVVVQNRGDDTAQAYLLRPDGTAYMRLDLVTLSDGTWRVETVESCPGEGLGG